MMYDLLILIGLAFFIKIFFDGAKSILSSKDKLREGITKKNFVIHGALGVLFIIAGRLLLFLH